MAFLLVESNCICQIKRHGRLLSFITNIFVAWVVAQLPRSFSLYCLSYPQSVRPCKRLVACGWSIYIQSGRLQGRLLHYVWGWEFFLFHVSQVAMQATGHLRLVPMQMYWSLAWSLVSNQGFLGKSYPGEVATTSSIDLSKRLVACSIFNGNQGGHLSHCHHIIMYMYFLLWIFSTADRFQLCYTNRCGVVIIGVVVIVGGMVNFLNFDLTIGCLPLIWIVWIKECLFWRFQENPCIIDKVISQNVHLLDYIQLLVIGWAGQWTRTPSTTPLQPKKWNAHFWITFNFWWSAERSEQIMLTKTQKNEKGPLSHRKIKCLFLDYIQLLMIGWVIWVVNGDWNAKKWPPKSSKNKMFIFWWSTRRLPEDQQKTSRRQAEDKQKTGRRQAEDCQKTTRSSAEQSEQKTLTKMQKKQKRPPKSSKNKMFFFWLHSTSDDRPSDPSKNVDQNTKKWKRPPKSSKNKMFVFGLRSTSDDWPSDLSKKCWPKCKKMKKAP